MLTIKRGLAVVVVTLFALSVLGLSAVQARQDGETPWLGVSVSDEDAGVTVAEVVPDSPAAIAGMAAGDVIVRIDDTVIDTVETLLDTLQTYEVGDTIPVELLTGDEAREVEITLAARPDVIPGSGPGAGPNGNQHGGPNNGPMMGRGVLNFLGISAHQTDQGWEIDSIEADSPLADYDLQAGDVITAVNGESMQAINARDLMRALRPGETVTLTLDRDGDTVEIEILLPEVGLEFDMDIPDMEMFDHGNLDAMAQQMLFQVLDIEGELTDEGLRLDAINENSPLAGTELAEGDVITALNGEAINAMTYANAIELLLAHETVTVSVLRDGDPLDVEVTLDFAGLGLHPMMPGMEMPFQVMPTQSDQPTQLGVLFAVITPDMAESENLPVTEGALIQEVYEGTPAEDAGLLAGDIITAVDGDVIDQERTLKDRLYAYESGDVVTLTVLRDGEELSLDVTLGLNPRDGLTYAPGNMHHYGFSLPFNDDNGQGFRFSVPEGLMGDLEQFFEDHPFLDGDFNFSMPKKNAPSQPEMRQS